MLNATWAQAQSLLSVSTKLHHLAHHSLRCADDEVEAGFRSVEIVLGALVAAARRGGDDVRGAVIDHFLGLGSREWASSVFLPYLDRSTALGTKLHASKDLTSKLCRLERNRIFVIRLNFGLAKCSVENYF